MQKYITDFLILLVFFALAIVAYSYGGFIGLALYGLAWIVWG